MVRAEDIESGKRINDVEGYWNIELQVKELAASLLEETEVSYESTLVVGRYGAGFGVPGKSDLDIVVLVSSTLDNRSQTYSQIMGRLAGKIEASSGQVLGAVKGINELECLVYPFLEKRHLVRMANESEHIEEYYDLTEEEVRRYYY